MRVDTLQLIHNCTNVFDTVTHFDAHRFLDAHTQSVTVLMCAQIVEAVSQCQCLRICKTLVHFLDTPMDITAVSIDLTTYIYDSLIRVTVTGATAGEVKISGTITTYGLDTLDGQTVSYPDSSGTFIVSKTVGGNSGNASNASQNANSSNNASHASSSVSGMKGQINCHGGTVAGFTTDYVVNSGACGIVRQSLGNTWHVTAKNSCYNYGITWYELWDSDDGDYYGWVDANYIDFY